jgi:hypothetical protein
LCTTINFTKVSQTLPTNNCKICWSFRMWKDYRVNFQKFGLLEIEKGEKLRNWWPWDGDLKVGCLEGKAAGTAVQSSPQSPHGTVGGKETHVHRKRVALMITL